jgi:glycine/D-amino acid oxidase-like deaminating enzyme
MFSHAIEQEPPSNLLHDLLRCPAGLKIGKFSVSEACDPDNLDRQQREADLVPLRAAVQAFMPHAAGELLDFAACMFTMTPDGHFVIDTHPKHEQVSQLQG